MKKEKNNSENYFEISSPPKKTITMDEISEKKERKEIERRVEHAAVYTKKMAEKIFPPVPPTRKQTSTFGAGFSFFLKLLVALILLNFILLNIWAVKTLTQIIIGWFGA